MSRNMLWVGWRLLVGKRGGFGQVVLMALGIGMAVTLLLAVAAVPTAVADRQTRDGVREWLLSGEPTADVENTELVGVGHDRFGGERLTHLVISGESSSDAFGLSIAQGEVLVSPALADTIANNPSLANRLHGRIAGTLPPEQLLEPEELVSLAHVEAETILATGDAQELPAGDRPPVELDVSSDVTLVASIALLALALPVAISIAAATRFGVERRRARVRVLTLSGAETNQIRFFVMVETVTAALFGLLIGFAFFGLLRPFLAKLEVGGRSTFPQALQPSPPLVAVMVVALLAVSVGASFAGTRRLLDSPMEVDRRTGVSWSGISLLLLGIAGLWIGASSPTNTDAPHPLALIGMVLVAVGFTLLGRTLVAGIGHALGTRTGNGVALLASGQMRRSPAETSRPLVAVATAVLLVVAFFTITGTLVRSDNPRYDNLPADRIVVEAAPLRVPAIVDLLQGHPGVEALTVQGLVGVAHLDGKVIGRGVVARCETVRETLDVRIDDCSSGVFASIDTTQLSDTELVISSGSAASGERVETAVPYNGAVFEGAFPASVIVDPAMVPEEFEESISLKQIIIKAKPNHAQLESIRTAIVAEHPTASIRSVAEIEDEFSASAREVRTLATIGLLAVLGMAAFSLAVGTASHLLQRRNTYAFLRAGGLTAGQIRSLIAIESTLPLAVFAAVGTLLGLVAGSAVATSAGTEPIVPWPTVLGVYVSAVLLSGIVWSLFAPSLDRLTSPTGLGFE